jgi:hypothetical protein
MIKENLKIAQSCKRVMLINEEEIFYSKLVTLYTSRFHP